MIATNYAFIIEKGFEVKVNGTSVEPHQVRLLFDTKGIKSNIPSIRPFVFKTKTKEGVSVFLSVGFTVPIPSPSDIEDEQESKKWSSQRAGWTITCNDRAVLSCDRTELTGWGDAGIPRYHTQFIAISGVVDFRCDDASKLPTTTTKRGIDASSPLYLQVKNKMREGMRIFTSYTNKWKGHWSEAKRHFTGINPMDFEDIIKEAESLPFTKTKTSVPKGEQYTPALPMPKNLDSRERRISFTKKINEIEGVSQHLFGSSDKNPSDVGEKCFDLVLRESKK